MDPKNSKDTKKTKLAVGDVMPGESGTVLLDVKKFLLALLTFDILDVACKVVRDKQSKRGTQ